MGAPRVCAVILTWNQEALTRDCLASLRACPPGSLAIVLVDNGSVDGSVARLSADFPEVEVLPQSRNLGFAAGNNVGIQRALARGAERVLLLNNDTLVDPGFLGPLDDALDRRPDVGIVGGKIFCHPEHAVAGGSDPVPGRDHPARETFWAAGATIDWEHGRQYHLGAGEEDRGQYDAEVEVDYVSACCLLARREVFERVGLLDPRYFIYFEETDWSVRARREGFRILYVPGARIWHRVSAAMTSGSPDSTYYLTRNRLLFLVERGPAERRRFYRWFYTTRPLRHAAALLARRDVARARAILEGLVDYHRGRFGPRGVAA